MEKVRLECYGNATTVYAARDDATPWGETPMMTERVNPTETPWSSDFQPAPRTGCSKKTDTQFYFGDNFGNSISTDFNQNKHCQLNAVVNLIVLSTISTFIAVCMSG